MTRKGGNHCAFCGREFPPETPWPRLCPACAGSTTIGLVPLVILVVRREGRLLCGEDHPLHEDAGPRLPAAFLDFGETWRRTAARLLGRPGRFRSIAAESDPEGIPRLYAEFEDEFDGDGHFVALGELVDPYDRELLGRILDR